MPEFDEAVRSMPEFDEAMVERLTRILKAEAFRSWGEARWKISDTVTKLLTALSQDYAILPKAERPAELWRVCSNPHSNDWNSEPENVIKHYHIFAHDADAGKYWAEMDGWHGFKQRHWVDAKSCFLSREEAERHVR